MDAALAVFSKRIENRGQLELNKSEQAPSFFVFFYVRTRPNPYAVDVNCSIEFMLPCHPVVTMVPACLFTLNTGIYSVDDNKKWLF